MDNLVSVITPIFNPGPELLLTLASVRNQTFQNYEHILIDDCSSKPYSTELMHLIDSDPKIRFFRRDWNGGPAVTRNRGISEAQGRYIAFLDADDQWHSDKLELQIEFMQSNNIALSYTAFEVVSSEDKVLGTRVPPSVLRYEDILKSNQIGCLTAIYDAGMLGKVFMPNIAKRQDMGLWLRILKRGLNAYGVTNKPLARYRVGHNSVSSNKFTAMKYQWRLYREVEKLPVMRSIKYFSYYSYRGLSRKV